METTVPAGPVMINPTTQLVIGKAKEEERARGVSYEDIGGLKPQLQRIREMIELPLRYPEIFERLGIGAPKGVLLHGPPGCGKTLIARAIANETEAKFFTISGPEIIHKFYGESEAHLRKIFEEASSKGPSIVFIDEIDAIAPRRDKVVGDVEKRVVAQLLALMDGLKRRSNIIVIAATNLPNALDPALRRPGRFDREIVIPIPDRNGRLEILEIYSRGMPLANDVNMGHLAAITHGFVGADLEALCREAAMSCLRTIISGIDFSLTAIPYEQLGALQVSMEHFLQAFTDVEPSAIREVFVEVPDIRWDDIGGLDGVKEHLVEAVEWPLKYPGLFERRGSGRRRASCFRVRRDAARPCWPRRSPRRARSTLSPSRGRRCFPSTSGSPNREFARFFKRPGRPPPASSFSMKSTRWCRREAGAQRIRMLPNAC